jgi:hypothetical protein
MFGLSKLMSPSIGLSFLRREIESALKFKVTTYEMHYNATEKKVHFIIPVYNDAAFEKRKYPFDNDSAGKLCEIVTGFLVNELPENTTIDYVVIYYDEKESKADVYYTNVDKSKEKQTIKL